MTLSAIRTWVIFWDENSTELDLSPEGIYEMLGHLEQENMRRISKRDQGLSLLEEEGIEAEFTEYYTVGVGAIMSNDDFFNDPQYTDVLSQRKFDKKAKRQQMNQP